MRVTVQGKLLRGAVKDATAITNPSDERPILRNLLLVADKTGLEITATDTFVSLWIKLPIGDLVKVEKEGKYVVNALNCYRLLDSMLNKDITLVGAERNLQVRASGSRHRLVIEDAREYPRIARFSSRKPYITVPANLVVKMIDRTSFCAHDEESFQLMHGMLTKAHENELRFVATDGQRLAVTTVPYETQSNPGVPFDAELVVPAAFVGAVKRIISTQTKTIDIQWMAGFLNFRTEVGEVSIRALAGEYPAYGLGIPTKLTNVVLDRKSFIEILKQATAIKSPTTNFVSLSFKPDKMVFRSQAAGAGDSRIDYEQVWEGESLAITINPDFMLKTVAAMRGEELSLEVGNIMTPTILREFENEHKLKSFCVYAVVRQ